MQWSHHAHPVDQSSSLQDFLLTGPAASNITFVLQNDLKASLFELFSCSVKMLLNELYNIITGDSGNHMKSLRSVEIVLVGYV